MLTRLGAWALWVANRSPWSNVYGFARSLLAGGLALTLAANHSSILFRPAAGVPDFPVCDGMRAASLFCLLRGHMELARALALIVLIVAASGWRPRLTAIPHWWISCSFMSTAIVIDGGDQLTSIVTLLLLPVALTDTRRWHWAPPLPGDAGAYRRLTAHSALVVIRVQVAVVYLHAAIGKLAVAEWQDGTALYYWMTDPTVGVSSPFVGIVRAVTSHGLPVVALTWGSIAVEFVLFMALVMGPAAKRKVLLLGVAFHLVIALAFGLISFSIAMMGALVLYLRSSHDVFELGLWSPPAMSMARSNHQVAGQEE